MLKVRFGGPGRKNINCCTKVIGITACLLILTVIGASIATGEGGGKKNPNIPELKAVPPFVLAYMGTGDDPY